MSYKRSRVDNSCSSRHRRRLVEQEAEIIYNSISNNTNALHCTSLENTNNSSKTSSNDDTASICSYTMNLNEVNNTNQTRNNDNNVLESKVNETPHCDVVMAELVTNRDENNDKYLENFLASWATQYNISYSALSELLCGLSKVNGLQNLPLDLRTLLNTPRFTEIHEIFPGHYFHFGLRKGIINILSDLETLPESVQLCINIDGLPLFKSTQAQFWPILGSLYFYERVFTIGIYYGSEKPADVNAFLNFFVAEAKELCMEGINVKNQHLQCFLHALICDAPARTFVLQVKLSHCGYNSCFKCVVEGQYCRGRVCFPKINDPLRTDEHFKEKKNDNYHKDNSTCNLLEIPNFGSVTNVPLDYMHLVCLGVMRKILNLLLFGDLNYRIGRILKERISSRLISFQPWISRVFVRTPRSLNYIALFKATEFRQLLLYTGPLALKFLRLDLYNHFLTLHVAIRIMCCKNLEMYLDYAQAFIEHFITSFPLLYGVHNVTHNVHSLVHLVNDVKKFGPLDNFSAFKYENFLQSIKPVVRKSEKPLQQIVRRVIEKENASTSSCNKTPAITKHFEPHESSLHYKGPLADNCSNPQYKIIKRSDMWLQCDLKSDNCCGLNDGSIVKVFNIAYCLTRKTLVIVGKEFLHKEELYTIPCPSSYLGIFLVHSLSRMKTWPLSDIVVKYVTLPRSDNKFAVLSLLHQEKSLHNKKKFRVCDD